MKSIAGIYRHYKGKDYEVLGVALQTETDEKVVVYRALYPCPDLQQEYGEYPIFVRPYTMFFEKIEIDGRLVPRFKLLEE